MGEDLATQAPRSETLEQRNTDHARAALFARLLDDDELYAREFDEDLWARELEEDFWARELEDLLARNPTGKPRPLPQPPNKPRPLPPTPIKPRPLPPTPNKPRPLPPRPRKRHDIGNEGLWERALDVDELD